MKASILVALLLGAVGCGDEAVDQSSGSVTAPGATMRREVLAVDGVSDVGAWAIQGGDAVLVNRSQGHFTISIRLNDGETVMGWGFELVVNEQVQTVIADLDGPNGEVNDGIITGAGAGDIVRQFSLQPRVPITAPGLYRAQFRASATGVASGLMHVRRAFLDIR